MSDVLIVFLSLSFSGSILALILFALRPLIKNRLSQTWQYYVWLLVILRFLLPFTPQVSIVGELAQYIQNVSNIPAVVDTDSGLHNDEQNTVLQSPDAFPASQTQQDIESEVTETPVQSAYWSDVLNNIWLLWIAVALVLLAHKIASYRSFVRFVKVGMGKITDTHILDIYRDEIARAKIKKALPLYANNQVVSPMLVGIVHPLPST